MRLCLIFPAMACCADGRPCGGYEAHIAPDPVREAAFSRYPKVAPRAHLWAAAPNGAPQFAGYDDGLRVPPRDNAAGDGDDPWEYVGDRLKACNFPLGGFGTGRVLLRGDGTLGEWTVVNQHRTDDGGLRGSRVTAVFAMPCALVATHLHLIVDDM